MPRLCRHTVGVQWTQRQSIVSSAFFCLCQVNSAALVAFVLGKELDLVETVSNWATAEKGHELCDTTWLISSKWRNAGFQAEYLTDWVEGCSGEIGNFSPLPTWRTSTNCHANTASCFMQDVWKPLWLRALLGFFSHSQVAESMSSVFVYKPAKYFLLNTCACVEHTATVWSWCF